MNGATTNIHAQVFVWYLVCEAFLYFLSILIFKTFQGGIDEVTSYLYYTLEKMMRFLLQFVQLVKGKAETSNPKYCVPLFIHNACTP